MKSFIESSGQAFVLLPIIIPFVTALVMLYLRGKPGPQRVVTVIGNSLHLISGGVLLWLVNATQPIAVQVGSWEAPFGITIVADLFSAIMVVMTGLVGVSVATYSIIDIDEYKTRGGFYFIYNILLTGATGAFLTGDLFNLYVWFEVLLIASFVLLALGGKRDQLEGALKYVTLNIVASLLFLSAAGLTYGLVGSLNMADIAVRIGEAPAGMVTTLAMLFLVAFGIKSAIFPLFSWLPAAYHTPPIAVTALFSGLMTKVGVYAILRVFSLIFINDANQNIILTVILVAATITMIMGVLGAVAQTDARRILSFHIVSQIGYMVIGIGLYSTLSIAGTIFFLVQHIIAKSTLFLISGIVNRIQGSFELGKLGGIYNSNPMMAALFFVPAMALAGIPPFSGFWAKFALVRAGLEAEQYLVVFVALFVSVLTLFSMTKIWAYAYWGERPAGVTHHQPTVKWWPLILPTSIFALLTILIGVFAGPIMDISVAAAEQLLDPSMAYLPAVLGR